MNETQLFCDKLHAIARSSSVQFADLAAGDWRGCSIQFRYTRDAKGAEPLRSLAPEDHGAADNGPAKRTLPDGDGRRYLIASITKPIVGLLAVQLAAEGRLTLNQPVRDFIDGFHRGALRTITIRHLLTHTSGLPDMLPNNNELRAQHAKLADFVTHTSGVSPDFVPGTNCKYSSMGFAILSSILEKTTDLSIEQLMSQRLFGPLKMGSSWLGIPYEQADALLPTVVPCQLPPWQQADSDWNWNSRYWRCLGAPWGGMISTVDDLGQLAVTLLNSGTITGGHSVLPAAAVKFATSSQTCHMSGLAEVDRCHRPWGLGWRLNWPDHSTCFSDFLPATTFGHWGATGTLMWVDPESRRWCVILTNQPYEESQIVIQRMSNLVASAS